MRPLVLLVLLALLTAGCVTPSPQAAPPAVHPNATPAPEVHEAPRPQPGTNLTRTTLVREGHWTGGVGTARPLPYAGAYAGPAVAGWNLQIDQATREIRLHLNWTSQTPTQVALIVSSPSGSTGGNSTTRTYEFQGTLNLTIPIAPPDPGNWTFRLQPHGASVDGSWTSTVTLVNGTFPRNLIW